MHRDIMQKIIHTDEKKKRLNHARACNAKTLWNAILTILIPKAFEK